VHVVRQFYPVVGGLERFVVSLAKEQRKLGIDAEIVTLNRVRTTPREALPRNDVVEGVPVRRIGFLGPIRYPLAPSVLFHIRKADIVHVHAVDFFCDYLALTRWLHRKPLVLTTHGGFFHTSFAHSLKKIYFSYVTPLSLRAYDRICACSRSDFDLFESVAGKRLMLVENGVDTNKFYGASSPNMVPTFVFIGRFSSNKGIDRLIDTIGALKSRVPSIKLHIVGTDWEGLLADMRVRISSLGCEDNIQIHLNQSDEQIRSIMKSASFFISASSYEGFALTTIECMSAGLVPITSQLPCFQEVIDATGVGMTLDFNDPIAAAGNIAEFYDRIASVHGNVREAAMVKSKTYDWSNAALRTTKEYERILGASPVALKHVGRTIG